MRSTQRVGHTTRRDPKRLNNIRPEYKRKNQRRNDQLHHTDKRLNTRTPTTLGITNTSLRILNHKDPQLKTKKTIHPRGPK